MLTMITLFFLIIFHSHRCFQTNIYSLQYFLRHVINTTTIRVLQNFTSTTMETAEYWLMAHEYAIWNATITSLQFWAEDLPATHYANYLKMFLFGCFVIALNAAFTQQLSLADEGYESGSDTVDLPTPLRKTPHIHHVLAWNMHPLIQQTLHIAGQLS